MARVRMVTRTIEVIKATALCVDVLTAETSSKELELTGVGNLSQNDLLKALKKTYETDTFKVVAVTEKFTEQELYGMLELDFLKYAKKLDPETRKMLEEDPEQDTTPETPIELEQDTTPETPVAPTKKSRKK